MRARTACVAVGGVLAAACFWSAPAVAAATCGQASFSYAGLAGNQPVSGVAATLTAIGDPLVQNGHVGAWVGVGGPGMGPHGADEWIQVGMSAFPDGSTQLYYEIALPDRPVRYVTLAAHVALGKRHKVEVLEMVAHPEWWRVWLDNTRVSVAFHLPGSHGAWRPVVTAESWNGGKTACNQYDYLFQRVSVARRDRWNRIVPGKVYRDPGYQILREPAGYRVSARAQSQKPPPKPNPAPAPDPAPQPAPASTDPSSAPPSSAATPANPATADTQQQASASANPEPAPTSTDAPVPPPASPTSPGTPL